MQDQSTNSYRKGNPEDFPVGSAWRRLLKKHNGVIPPLPDEVLKQKLNDMKAEYAERLTPTLNPAAHRLVRDVAQRLGLPELPVYIASGRDVQPDNAKFVAAWGPVLMAEDYLEPPLGRFESALLHEVGHGFEDERFLLSARKAVLFLDRMTRTLSWSNTLMRASSCLYTAATLMHNAAAMAGEVWADRFAIQHGSELSLAPRFLAESFCRKHHGSASFAEGRSPFTPLAVVNDLVDFLDHLLDSRHPPTSIRYVLAAREVARENQKRQLYDSEMLPTVAFRARWHSSSHSR